MAKNSPEKARGSLARALVLLDAFSIEDPELGIREISRKIDVPPSSVSRIVQMLQAAGVLWQNPATLRYRLGAKILYWSWLFEETTSLRKIAIPIMQQLESVTKETVSLFVAQDSHRICIEWIQSPQAMRYDTRPGERIPIQTGASGKLLMAYMEPDRLSELLQPERLHPFTDATITDPALIKQELEEIQRLGYAISRGEFVPGVAAISAPIRDLSGEVIATVSISGPRTRMTEQCIEEYVPLLLESANEISKSLGYQ